MPAKGKRVEPGSLKGGKSEPSTRSKLGTGKRFAALKKKLTSKGVKDPDALAASIGRAKVGTQKMAKLASSGKKSKAKK